MWKWLVFLAIVFLLASGAYQLILKTGEIKDKAALLEEKAMVLQKENDELNDQLKYLANPENL